MLPHRFDGVCLSDPPGTLQLLDTYITIFYPIDYSPREHKSAKALRTITLWCSDLSQSLADLKAPGKEVVVCDGIESAARSTTDG